ncbi:hypothetical protein TWF730_000222 [Orbilia blumenaviensis]|uniref:Peptidase S8/S53 domain-containing protein n=1 Tax=Orbilia blumenaviensis TaxID=1796055 RepID=A0AAV9VMY8_9PEZI
MTAAKNEYKLRKREYLGIRQKNFSIPHLNNSSSTYQQIKAPKQILEPSINKDSRSNVWTKRDDHDEVVAQRNAPTGLSILSAPRPQDSGNYQRLDDVYFHYKNPGAGVVVYVLELGLNILHTEFEEVVFEDWIAGGVPPLDPFTGEPDGNYHSGGMVAKIVGKTTGIAQNASIVFSAVMDGTNNESAFSKFDAFLKTYDHIRSRNSNKPCIISISIGFWADPSPLLGPTMRKKVIAYQDTMIDILVALTDLDNVIIVAAAGNGPAGTPLTSFPSRFAVVHPNRRMVVAGAANSNGIDIFQSDSSLPNFVWFQSAVIETIDVDTYIQQTIINVPAEIMRMGWWPLPHRLKLVGGGTSFAASTVAGVLALYLSRDQYSGQELDMQTRMNNAIQRLKDESWKVNPAGVPIVHSGIAPNKWPPEFVRTSNT